MRTTGVRQRRERGASVNREQYLLYVIGNHIQERLAQHRDNLPMWQEPTGYLLPTEPDPEERERVRRELKACIFELEWIARIVSEAKEIAS